jgi:hypothetical protein
MIAMRLEVVTDDGVEQFPVTPKVQVEFERQFKTGIGKAFADEQKVEHIYWLAWKASHAAGRIVKPFDGWLDGVLDVKVISDAAPLDETASPG